MSFRGPRSFGLKNRRSFSFADTKSNVGATQGNAKSLLAIVLHPSL